MECDNLTEEYPTKDDLLKEIITLNEKICELSDKLLINREDQLKLAILKQVPFSMWACDKNFNIKLWTCNCENIYEISKDDAIDENYLDLFVDNFERDQSKIDCLRVINKDYNQHNFLAYDKNENDDHILLLTNCFRIYDEVNDEYLQAEVALDISDLDLEMKMHKWRTLRDYGKSKHEDKLRIVHLQRSNLMYKLQQIQKTKINKICKDDECNVEWMTKAKEHFGEEKIEDLKMELKKSKDESHNFDSYRLFQKKIISAKTLEELDEIEDELDKYSKTTI